MKKILLFLIPSLIIIGVGIYFGAIEKEKPKNEIKEREESIIDIKNDEPPKLDAYVILLINYYIFLN